MVQDGRLPLVIPEIKGNATHFGGYPNLMLIQYGKCLWDFPEQKKECII